MLSGQYGMLGSGLLTSGLLGGSGLLCFSLGSLDCAFVVMASPLAHLEGFGLKNEFVAFFHTLKPTNISQCLWDQRVVEMVEGCFVSIRSIIEAPKATIVVEARPWIW